MHYLKKGSTKGWSGLRNGTSSKCLPKKPFFANVNFQKFSEFKISFDNIYFQITWFDRTLWNHSFWIILNHLGSSGEERRLEEHFFIFIQVPISPVKDLHFSFLVSNFENFGKNLDFWNERLTPLRTFLEF